MSSDLMSKSATDVNLQTETVGTIQPSVGYASGHIDGTIDRISDLMEKRKESQAVGDSKTIKANKKKKLFTGAGASVAGFATMAFGVVAFPPLAIIGGVVGAIGTIFTIANYSKPEEPDEFDKKYYRMINEELNGNIEVRNKSTISEKGLQKNKIDGDEKVTANTNINAQKRAISSADTKTFLSLLQDKRSISDSRDTIQNVSSNASVISSAGSSLSNLEDLQNKVLSSVRVD